MNRDDLDSDDVSLGPILVAATALSIMIVPLWVWDHYSDKAKEAHIANIIAAASEMTSPVAGRITPGTVVLDPTCQDDSCLRGTILSLPTKEQCGVIFIGDKGEEPKAVVVIGRPARSVANPNMRSFCP